jgi:DNA-binding XRE family transcriptional regulator
MEQEHDGRKQAGCLWGDHFKGNLRFWRRRRRLNIKEAAGKLGVAKSAWSQWESGKRSPSVASVNLIARTLGLPSCCFHSNDPARCLRCLARDKPVHRA